MLVLARPCRSAVAYRDVGEGRKQDAEASPARIAARRRSCRLFSNQIAEVLFGAVPLLRMGDLDNLEFHLLPESGIIAGRSSYPLITCRVTIFLLALSLAVKMELFLQEQPSMRSVVLQ